MTQEQKYRDTLLQGISNQSGLKRLEALLDFLNHMGLNTKNLTVDECTELTVGIREQILKIMLDNKELGDKLVDV
jgi:hypothetical protein